MEEVVPGGKCEGGQIQKGSYNVTKSGMYALVFGNSHPTPPSLPPLVVVGERRG